MDPALGEGMEALYSVGAHLRFWLVAVCGLALDLYSKYWAFEALEQGAPPRVVVPRVLELQLMFNPGALFGIGAGYTTLFLVASLLALSLVLWMFLHSSARRWSLQIALGAILAGALGNMYDRMTVRLVEHPVYAGGVATTRYFVREPVSADDARPDTIVLTEYPPNEDALRLHVPSGMADSIAPERAYVRDFLKIPTTFGERELWPWVFNVADMLLVGGVGLLAIRLWRDRKSAPVPDAEAT